MSASDMTSQFALDMNGFQRLQHNARVDPEAGVGGGQPSSLKRYLFR